MRDSFFFGVGGVLSADIAVPEHERELGFYSKVLTTGPAPLWRDDLSNNQGTPIIGLGERSPEYESLPLQWLPHFQVADVGQSVARTLELGGEEVMHAKGEDGQSQWAVLLDPIGAAFGLIPVVPDDGTSDPNAIGHISWLSLVTSDVDATCEFYEQVIGYSAVPANERGGREMRRPDGGVAAEIFPMEGEHAKLPSVWLLSLPVDDFGQSLQYVRESGGEVVAEAADAGHAVIRDPVGVYVALQAH